jgi:hypothetical protein
MNFILVLAHQPLFRLLGAVIVLLLTDMRPAYGLIAGLVWTLWIFIGYESTNSRHIF